MSEHILTYKFFAQNAKTMKLSKRYIMDYNLYNIFNDPMKNKCLITPENGHIGIRRDLIGCYI